MQRGISFLILPAVVVLLKWCPCPRLPAAYTHSRPRVVPTMAAAAPSKAIPWRRDESFFTTMTLLLNKLSLVFSQRIIGSPLSLLPLFCYRHPPPGDRTGLVPPLDKNTDENLRSTIHTPFGIWSLSTTRADKDINRGAALLSLSPFDSNNT